MDDIIVIILTLVLTIVAAINQSKKKKQHESQNTGSEPDFWETILHGEEGTPVPVKTTPKKQPSASVRQQPLPGEAKIREPLRKPVSTAGYQSVFNSVEGARNEDVQRASNRLVSDIENPEDRENYLSILEGFSLRKAIIYSEIIQPKYF